MSDPHTVPAPEATLLVPCEPTEARFKVGDPVIYRGKTYSFPGTVCGVTDDGQVIVRATGAPDGSYAGMKHIYGPAQLTAAPTTPTRPNAAGEDDAMARFTAYFVKNYPGPDTIIYKPEWHAPQLFRAAKAAMRQAGLLAASPTIPVQTAGAVEAPKLRHGLDVWAEFSPEAIVNGSHATRLMWLEDAKADIAALARSTLAAMDERLAALSTPTVEAGAALTNAVVRAAWALLDNTADGGLEEQEVQRADWQALSDAMDALEKGAPETYRLALAHPSAPTPPAQAEGDAGADAKRFDALFNAFLESYADHDGPVPVNDLADYLADVRRAVASALASRDADLARLRAENAIQKEALTERDELREDVTGLRADLARVTRERDYLNQLAAEYSGRIAQAEATLATARTTGEQAAEDALDKLYAEAASIKFADDRNKIRGWLRQFRPMPPAARAALRAATGQEAGRG